MTRHSLMRRSAVILEISDRKTHTKARLGKTAMQKLVFLLQEAFGCNLDYHFNLYTYGPYDAALMNDLDFCATASLIQMEEQTDSGYKISPGSKAEELDSLRGEIRRDCGDQIDQLLNKFGEMNASDLELRATIFHIHSDNRDMGADEVQNLTRKIKPKFSSSEIKKAFNQLKDWKLIN